MISRSEKSAGIEYPKVQMPLDTNAVLWPGLVIAADERWLFLPCHAFATFAIEVLLPILLG